MAIVKPGQTLLDVAVQYMGDASGLPALAAANGLYPNSPLTPGASLVIPTPINKRVVEFYRRGGYEPASTGGLTTLDGIDYCAIEDTFIVA